jgi:hypothetical protein
MPEVNGMNPSLGFGLLKLTSVVQINRGMRNVSALLVLSCDYLTGPIPSLPSALAKGEGITGSMGGRNDIGPIGNGLDM